MSHLRTMLAGYWVTDFDIHFVAQPPLPDPESDPNKAAYYDRPNITNFSLSSAIAYLHLTDDGKLTGGVSRNDGRNGLGFGALSGSYSVGVSGFFGLAAGTITLNFATFDVLIKFIVRNQSEFVFAHEKFVPKSGQLHPEKMIAPLTHGTFRRATPFIADPIIPEPPFDFENLPRDASDSGPSPRTGQ